jgi:hypothetical protein
MAYKFTLTEIIREYTHIKEEYGYVEVSKVYECSNYDDLQNLFLTLVDFTADGKTLKFEVKKETFDEEVTE